MYAPGQGIVRSFELKSHAIYIYIYLPHARATPGCSCSPFRSVIKSMGSMVSSKKTRALLWSVVFVRDACASRGSLRTEVSSARCTRCSTFGAAGEDHRVYIWDDLWAGNPTGLRHRDRDEITRKPHGLCLYHVAVVRPR